ncbi:MAG: hypothetical protein ACRD68_05875, partial [Pyrinomonadaceae bacterium]
MSTSAPTDLKRREVGGNVWLTRGGADPEDELSRLSVHEIRPEIIETEEMVGRAMLGELEAAARAADGDLTIAILGGRGAQAMHRLLGERARGGDPGGLVGRLNVFTQDALAPMRMDNGLSFVRDFERLLGEDFFRKVKSFTPMRT